MTQSHSTVQRIVPIHVFTSTPCILYPLTITEFIVIISVSSHPFGYLFYWFVRGLGMLQNIKVNAPRVWR